MQEVNAPGCGRENDLVTFLYGELSDVEKRSFESHIHACRLCQAQASEFRSIRESVAEWRYESLGRGYVASVATSGLIDQRKRSSLAALRAFFDLSPLWMKGAVGFAAILFCIFAALTVAHLLPASAPLVTTTNVSSQGYSQEQMNALVERRVQEELASRKFAEERPPASQPSLAVKEKTVGAPSRALSSRSSEVTTDSRNGKARRPLSKTEREQLAADLRLVSSSNERGVDLVDDQINQP